MNAEALTGFDLVSAVIENTVQGAVNVRHVIATIEIIIDKNFPIAFDDIRAAFEPRKLLKRQFLNSFSKIFAEKRFK